MKTSMDIKREIFDLANFQVKLTPTSKEFKQNKKRIEYLNECVLYLETSPSEEFLEREVKRLEAQIAYLDKQFEIWLTSQHLKIQAAPQKSKKNLPGKGGCAEAKAAAQYH